MENREETPVGGIKLRSIQGRVTVLMMRMQILRTAIVLANTY